MPAQLTRGVFPHGGRSVGLLDDARLFQALRERRAMSGIDASMFELFREEVRAHADTLARGLLDAGGRPGDPRSSSR